MPALVLTSHIELDQEGGARISGSRIKVIHLAMERVHWNLTPEQIQQGHPHLTMAQVYAALSHYHDNKAYYDAEMERIGRQADESRSRAGESPFVTRMRAEGALPKDNSSRQG
jgi:uncharacterized protein (DUF433 family)